MSETRVHLNGIRGRQRGARRNQEVRVSIGSRQANAIQSASGLDERIESHHSGTLRSFDELLQGVFSTSGQLPSARATHESEIAVVCLDTNGKALRDWDD